MITVEDIILRHSGRGMDILRPYLPEDFCHAAAKALLSLEKGTVLLTTGFCVGGSAETDGPAGTIAVANALRKLGFDPVFVTDELCRGVFESEGFKTEYFPLDATEDTARELLAVYRPAGLFSLERCGVNISGRYASMRGINIRSKTAPVDLIFMLSGGIPTFGVGDGGNEIGMGNLSGIIQQHLDVTPCAVTVDHLIIATVSNWGGYGICACLKEITGLDVMPQPCEVAALMCRLARFGLVDGMSGIPAITEDGFPESVTYEILSALNGAEE